MHDQANNSSLFLDNTESLAIITMPMNRQFTPPAAVYLPFDSYGKRRALSFGNCG